MKVVALVAALVLLGASPDLAIVPCCDNVFPTLTCQPGVMCDLGLLPDDHLDPQLQPVVDSTSWTIVSENSTPPHVYFRPTTPSAPRTLMTVSTTNGRAYHFWIQGVSHSGHVAYTVAPPRMIATSSLATPASTPTPEPPLILRGVYHQMGIVPFQPARIGNDGLRTYVFFNQQAAYPIPLAADGKSLLNFSPLVLPNGGREYVLAGVLDHFILKLGDGRGSYNLRIDRIADHLGGNTQ